MKFNCKHTVVAKCLKLGAEMMPKHFAGMIFAFAAVPHALRIPAHFQWKPTFTVKWRPV